MLNMEAPSIEMVYQAISALYDNPNGEEKEKASIWLGDVQKSVSICFLIYFLDNYKCYKLFMLPGVTENPLIDLNCGLTIHLELHHYT